jgi:hypothetical protein
VRNVVGERFRHRSAGRIGSLAKRLDVAADRQHKCRDVAHEALELVVLGYEIGFGINLDNGATVAADGNADEAFGGGPASLLGAAERPLARSQSTDVSISPSFSARAFLQSIMPAPVRSRSSFTEAAVISAIDLSFCFPRLREEC